MKKIFMRLAGGLGNQMFQYAAGRSLSLELNAQLYLDLDEFSNTTNTRRYELGEFNICADTYCSGFRRDKIRNIFKKTQKLLTGRYYREPTPYCYDKDFLKLRDGTYITGFFQAFDYFKANLNHIRKEFCVVGEQSGSYQKKLMQIKQSEAVCVHIRRGDYLSTPILNVCDLNYYTRGIEIVTSNVPNAHLFIFSDDIVWARENLLRSTTLTFQGEVTYMTVDLAESAVSTQSLMRACKHFVISNSTFSYWAALLSNSDDKIVVMPKLWSLDNSSEGLMPSCWLRA